MNKYNYLQIIIHEKYANYKNSKQKGCQNENKTYKLTSSVGTMATARVKQSINHAIECMENNIEK